MCIYCDLYDKSQNIILFSQKAIDKELKVMDLPAITLCKETIYQLGLNY